MVGNKSDLEGERKVNKEVAKIFAKDNNLLFLETSAKNGNNIEKIFQILSEQILTKIETGLIDPESELGIKRGDKSKSKSQKSIESDVQVEPKVDKKGCSC